MNDVEFIVIDNGSAVWKGGFAGASDPQTIFPTVLGRPKYVAIMVGMGQKDCFVGDEAISHRGVLKLSSPIERGSVTNWDDMEKLLHHMFYTELRVAPEEHPVLMTQLAMNPHRDPEKLTQMLFETFNAPAIHLALSGMLALYSYGKTTGAVLDCGEGSTHVIPVWQGVTERNSWRRAEYGGIDVTDYLQRILNERNVYLRYTGERENVRELKEKCAYVALDFDREIELSRKNPTKTRFDYELPDGHWISVENERFRCTETLFRPSFLTKEACGLHEVLYNSIQNCDQNLTADLYENICLSGGTTLLRGFEKRLRKELMILAPHMRDRLKIHSSPDRRFAAWIGGSILASLSTMQSRWFTKVQYDEFGPILIHKKCYL